MKDMINFINKDKQKKYLELFMILDEIARKEDIISFTYENNYLLVRVGVNDYYRINMEEVIKC